MAADKKVVLFKPGPADSYEHKQTVDKLTIAALPYTTAELAKPAFGKLNPYEHGVLPVLMVMKNDSDRTLQLSSLRVECVGPDRSHIEAVSARDLRYLSGARNARVSKSPLPTGSPRIKTQKNPFAGGEMELREFAARMLPPGDSAHGFLYFQTGHRPGSHLYVTGIRDARTSKELFYFEIPLD